MPLPLYFTLILILVSSCQDPTISNKGELKIAIKDTSGSKTHKVKQEKKRADQINDKNVKERLLAYGLKNAENKVILYTDLGIIKVQLYKDTPLHRANFIMMAKNGCYNNIVFSRAVREFIAQAGSTYDQEVVDIRNAIGKYSIPSEMSKAHFHKHGALAAARRYNNNPKKRSDPYSFYFVEGSTYNKATLDKYQVDNNYTYTKEQRSYYSKNLGAAHIDGEHTVFGEVIEGQDIIKKITEVKTNGSQWPLKDIYIQKVEVAE